eukprot:3347178-Rhodomonas_salina.1
MFDVREQTGNMRLCSLLNMATGTFRTEFVEGQLTANGQALPHLRPQPGDIFPHRAVWREGFRMRNITSGAGLIVEWRDPDMDEWDAWMSSEPFQRRHASVA